MGEGKVSIQMQVRQSKGLKAKSDFTQQPNGVGKCFNLSRGAKQLWTELYSYSYNGGDIFAGIDRMTVNLGVSRATIMRDTKELVDIGLVEIEHRGFSQTNMYTLYDANDLGLPNGSRPYMESHPEEFDGYRWKGKNGENDTDEQERDVAQADYYVAQADHYVASMVHEEDEVEEDKNNKTKHMSFSKASIEEKTKERPTLKEVKAIASELVDHLNVTAKKNYRNNKHTTSLIRDLLIGDVALADLILVVDYKVSRWLDDSKMNDYLRPATLFSEKNFDDYLAESVEWSASGRKQPKSKFGYRGIVSDDNYGSIVK